VTHPMQIPFFKWVLPPGVVEAAVRGAQVILPQDQIAYLADRLGPEPCIGCGIGPAKSIYLAAYETSPVIVVPCCDGCSPKVVGYSAPTAIRVMNTCREIFEGNGVTEIPPKDQQH